MKKLKALTILNLIILTIIISSVTIRTTQPNADVNQDGKVTSMDLLVLKRHIVGYKELTPYQQKIADMNQDGVLDDNDLAIIQAYIIYE